MTPLLRAGLGGLAATVRALLREADPTVAWPSPLELAGGQITVGPRDVEIAWGAEGPSELLEGLFQQAFRVRHPEGLIDVPGWWEVQHPELALAAALQSGVKRKFLQHGKTTEKGGRAIPRTAAIDGHETTVMVQPYRSYAHQKAWKEVVGAIMKGQVQLASWAYPGAVQRHIGFSKTKWTFGPGEALSSLFGLVGCLSFEVPRSRGSGVLVIPEPTDLVAFAHARPRLTPKRLADAYVTGPGDAILSVHLALSLDKQLRHVHGIGAVHGMSLRAMAWSPQQKTRAAVLAVQALPEQTLDQYYHVQQSLPIRIVVRAKDHSRDSATDDNYGFFAASSHLRWFVSENLAAGNPWHRDFATAKTPEKAPRLLHYYRSKTGLGALYLEEKNGLITMIPHLEDAETVLVRSVHQALRQRFGAIAHECRGLPRQTMKNRMTGERDRWRLAFAGAKIPEQIRAALADLWSRAGSNGELRQSWESVLPLLRADRWRTARDLALVALASYAGKGSEVAVLSDESIEQPATEEEDS